MSTYEDRRDMVITQASETWRPNLDEDVRREADRSGCGKR
jgi:hypothetical protein